MKNSKRRLLSLIMVLTLILSATAVLSSCYIIKSGKMKDIEGTYQLTTYSRDTDLIEKRGIVLYVVIRADGTGYYAYKSNGTEPHIAELRCSFTSDSEKSGHYSNVAINFGYGSDATNFGITAGSESSSINSNTTYWGDKWDIKWQYVTLKRVSKATDLSYINENFGAYDVLPYGLLKANGGYDLLSITSNTGDDVNPFVYYLMDVNLYTLKTTVWYMLKQDEVACVETFDIKDLTNYSFTIDNTVVTVGNNALSFAIDGESTAYLSAGGYYDEEYVKQLIDTKYGAYLTQKTTTLFEEGVRSLMTDGVADPTKYSPEKFAAIDSYIADLLGKYGVAEKSLNDSLVTLYKKARLYYLYNDALANVESAYAASTEPAREIYRDTLLTRINSAYIKSYTFAAVVDCHGEHEEGEACDCTEFVLAEDPASSALAEFSVEYCNGIFKVIAE